MVDFLKFTTNKKNIEWSYCLNLQPSLLPYFFQSLVMLGLKKILGLSQFFLRIKKVINFLNLYVIIIIFSRSGWCCDHPGLYVEPLVSALLSKHLYPFFNHPINQNEEKRRGRFVSNCL